MPGIVNNPNYYMYSGESYNMSAFISQFPEAENILNTRKLFTEFQG